MVSHNKYKMLLQAREELIARTRCLKRSEEGLGAQVESPACRQMRRNRTSITTEGKVEYVVQLEYSTYSLSLSHTSSFGSSVISSRKHPLTLPPNKFD